MPDLFPESSDATGIWRVGTAGWSYPRSSGPGTWTGVFYPPSRVDELRFYSRYFNTVEVNSTFYRPSEARTTQAWVERTPEGFEFTLKAPREFTHDRENWGPAHAGLFEDGLMPLAEHGRLGGLLFQFPASFHRTDANRLYLERLLVRFADFVRIVELRHGSWSGTDDAAGLGAVPAFIDEPKFEDSIRQELRPSRGILYVRFHGRRADTWWRHRTREERYDYLYSREEIEDYAARIEEVARRETIEKAYLFFNTHPGAKAVANAVTMRRRLRIPVRAPLPEALVERFPDLGQDEDSGV